MKTLRPDLPPPAVRPERLFKTMEDALERATDAQRSRIAFILLHYARFQWQRSPKQPLENFLIGMAEVFEVIAPLVEAADG